jgi:hypothetical protein
LRKALDSSNFGSTSGWDGISFKVIRKFWDVLSKPMLKMINETFNEGELMETYKLGLIKLIPKKGEAAKVGDWRPITLLCCGYKVISGIVAKRLEKYLDKLIGRAQKGFMKNKNIHTCTLNIMNSIDRAWNLGREVGVMCVDFSKAFDSVEHEMIKNVMVFFGFGDRMTKMVMTLLKGRTSRVILDDGYSKTIHIARGTPQGDRSSPYIFILCIEVLLIKLRLESNGLVNDSELFLEWQELEDRRMEPLTGEAYADDLTVIFNMSRECVHNILKILESFFMVSGLSVNTDKTQLMVVGSENWVEGDRVCGIKVVEKVNILGVKIDRRNRSGPVNWENVISKIERLTRYWTTFGLSITGRVMVAKTYLMSQAIYLMNVLPMDEEYGSQINEIMLNFVKGTDRLIERRRQFVCAELGGYGLVDIKVMDLCVKTSWIERWKREGQNMDYPALIMWRGDIELRNRNLKEEHVRDKGMRMMKEIYNAYSKFKVYYNEFGNNINVTEIFGNTSIMDEGRNMEEAVFGLDRYRQIKDIVDDKVVGAVCNQDGSIRQKEEIDRTLGIRMNWAEYFRLRAEVEWLRVRFTREINCQIRELNTDNFMTGRRKGIRKYRWVIEGRHSRTYKESDPTVNASVITL